MRHRPSSQREKTQRAWSAYLDLIDTAEWIKKELRAPLSTFGLTMEEFRLLLELYRAGPLTIPMVADKRERNRQNMHATIISAQEFGWVEKEVARLRPARIRKSRLPKARRGRPRAGRRISVVRLTGQGEKLVGHVLPKQVKVVKALMRAIDGRRQATLSEICRKLRAGDVVKFVKEMVMTDPDEELIAAGR